MTADITQELVDRAVLTLRDGKYPFERIANVVRQSYADLIDGLAKQALTAHPEQPTPDDVPEVMSLEDALGIADHPSKEDTLCCPADTREDLYAAIDVLAKARRIQTSEIERLKAGREKERARADGWKDVAECGRVALNKAKDTAP